MLDLDYPEYNNFQLLDQDRGLVGFELADGRIVVSTIYLIEGGYLC